VALVEKQTSAAPACTAAASRRRRCCRRPKYSEQCTTQGFGIGLGNGPTCRRLASGQQAQERHRIQPSQGLSGLLKRRKITVSTVRHADADGAVAVDGQTLSGRRVIICAGSEPRPLPGLEIDGKRIVTSDQATNSDADALPERVAVIGGGVIGAEFASVYTDFGVQTTLLEALPHGVLPIGPDRDTADVLAKALPARHGHPCGSPRRAVELTSNGVLVPFETPRARRRSRLTSCSSPLVGGRSARAWVWTMPA
jgi:dihydrolipoamide dehydrogenase